MINVFSHDFGPCFFTDLREKKKKSTTWRWSRFDTYKDIHILLSALSDVFQSSQKNFVETWNPNIVSFVIYEDEMSRLNRLVSASPQCQRSESCLCDSNVHSETMMQRTSLFPALLASAWLDSWIYILSFQTQVGHGSKCVLIGFEPLS